MHLVHHVLEDRGFLAALGLYRETKRHIDGTRGRYTSASQSAISEIWRGRAFLMIQRSAILAGVFVHLKRREMMRGIDPRSRIDPSV